MWVCGEDLRGAGWRLGRAFGFDHFSLSLSVPQCCSRLCGLLSLVFLLPRGAVGSIKLDLDRPHHQSIDKSLTHFNLPQRCGLFLSLASFLVFAYCRFLEESQSCFCFLPVLDFEFGVLLVMTSDLALDFKSRCFPPFV